MKTSETINEGNAGFCSHSTIHVIKFFMRERYLICSQEIFLGRIGGTEVSLLVGSRGLTLISINSLLLSLLGLGGTTCGAFDGSINEVILLVLVLVLSVSSLLLGRLTKVVLTYGIDTGFVDKIIGTLLLVLMLLSGTGKL